MKLTERLLDAAQHIWAQYNVHPFVLGIQNGNLDREKFRWYMIQDYWYLMEYTKVFAIGVAKSHSIEAMKVFNEVRADFPCIIKKVLVENGKPVKQGDALFAIERV